jgi:cytochrome c-type biogenesis protein CcmE
VRPLSKKLRLQLGSLVILGALVYLGLQGAHSFSQYFIPVSQFDQQMSRFSGQVVQVQGRLVADSIRYDAAKQTLMFTLASGRYQLPVKYVGPVPTEQYVDASAIVEGELGPHGVFQARKLMIQCPDHYKAVKVTADSAHNS